jgi:hypothetical protein
MVGCVCARSGESDKALEHFEYIAAREQEHQIDEEIYVEMGMIHEGRNAEKVGKLVQETLDWRSAAVCRKPRYESDGFEIRMFENALGLCSPKSQPPQRKPQIPTPKSCVLSPDSQACTFSTLDLGSGTGVLPQGARGIQTPRCTPPSRAAQQHRGALPPHWGE